MQQPESKPGLIHNWPAALVTLCLTGLVTLSSFREVLFHAQHTSPWLLDLRFMLPPWATTAVNLGFYAYLLWLSVWFYRGAQGKERVVVAGWFVGFWLHTILNLIPMSAATNFVRIVGNVIAFAADGVAFVAAVYICKIFARDYPPTGNQVSRDNSK